MALFSEHFIRRVRDANDIAQIVESYNVALRRTGTNFIGLCPFHNEKTPSFNVNPQLQIFKCFGCGVGGDAFKFIQLIERVEFPESIEILANRAGIPVEKEEGQEYRREKSDTDSREALLWANSRALAYFERMLADQAEGRRAREYLLGRGFTKETISTWRLGWAPERWDGLLEAMVREAGEHKRDKVLKAGVLAGVLRKNDEGRVYDAFRGRVMFPILDNRHRPIGFGGRVFEEKPEAGGKYINTSEGRLFQKRKLLFGLNFAAKEITLTKTAVVVEGYTDTIMSHQYGIRNTIATLGTSLTREHVQLLRRYIQPNGRVIALFDSDAAGEKATERASEIFMEEDVPLHIVRNLEVKDAGEFLPKYGVDAFKDHMAGAVDSFNFVLQQSMRNCGNDVSSRAAAVAKVMEFVNRSPNRVKREMMRKEVSARSGVPEESLPRKAADSSKESRFSKPSTPARRGLGSKQAAQKAMELVIDSASEGRMACERRLVRYMFERKEWSEKAADRFPPYMFRDNSCSEMAKVIRDAWDKGNRPEPSDLMAADPENAGGLIAELTMRENETPLSNEE
ncbi:MAG: DNA primase, partial [Planctomycetes bacterium]|nr:DNA primase [Planctomycetota bacterium]